MNDSKVVYARSFRWRDDLFFDTRPAPKIKYDDIVDDTDFKTLKQQNRLTRLSQEGAGQGQGNGVFDFDGPKKPSKSDFDRVSDAEVALREGRLDKADVDVLKSQYEEQAHRDLKASEDSKASAREKAISRQRQEFIDRELGFSPETNSVNSPDSSDK